MKKYKEIHIWNFPPIETYIKLEEKFRHCLLSKFIKQFKNESLAITHLNNRSKKYGIERKYSRGMFHLWGKGYSNERNKRKTRTIPLWVLIEISKYITKTKFLHNQIMEDIEKNIEYYNAVSGSSRIIKPRLPIYLTPELISIIFHFCGDGA